MNYTPNLNLKKPAKTDPVLIDDLNDNMDILDQEVKDIRDTLDQEVEDVRDTLDQEVEDIRDTLDQVVDAHAETRAALDELGHVNHAVLTTTLDTTWQGSEAPYTKTQTLNGLLATDVPIVDVVLSGDWEVDEARLEAWGYIYRIVTSNDSITAYAREKPDVALPLQLKVVR